MKKLLAVFTCLVLFANCLTVCATAEPQSEVICFTTDLGNGITVVDTITVFSSQARSTDKVATHLKEYLYNDEVIAEIEIKGTFRYTGTTVSVVSKSISKCETYDGWSFKQSSFTSSGGTVSLTGKLTKLLVLNANVSISLTCDENGNIS